MPVPTVREWKEVAEDFHRLWNFPNCLGSIDGTHVQIQAPASTGSLFHNYTGHFSVVLLAVVDAHYHFRVIDVGAYGNSSDGGTLAASAFGKALYSQTLQLPADVPLHGAEDQSPVPHVFVADEAFPLRRELMRPYPGQNNTRERRVFNYRLSRARRMVECTFGILATQWRLYRRVLGVSPLVAERVVKATCILHNLLHWETKEDQDHPTLSSVEQCAVQHLDRLGSNNASREA